MPPKTESKILIGKQHNAVRILEELCEELEAIFEIQPQLERLKSIFDQLEAKYRSIQKQQEVIADRLLEEGIDPEDERVQTNRLTGKEATAKYLQAAKRFAAYQKDKECPPDQTAAHNADALEAMTSAVKQMAECLMGTKSNSSSGGLERLPVPAWDGNRRSYSTWKKEFQHWMTKYGQDEEEQLQRFKKAMPKNSWWTDQVKTCKTIKHAWEMLDIDFADKRKLMDELLADITNLRSVKGDSKSFTQYAAILTGFVNDMTDNGCPILTAAEAPFLMSQLLSKLDAKDNVEFGREMRRSGKEENITNLTQWLHEEASLRGRGKGETYRTPTNHKSSNHTTENSKTGEEPCPLGCVTEHLLSACPTYQSFTVDQRWDVVKQHNRCRKCLRKHHTKECKKADGVSCDKCKKNHHRSLHNERRDSKLNPNATPFTTPAPTPPESSSTRDIANAMREEKNMTGLCPIQKVKVTDASGEHVEILAMLDTGSNTSLLSKAAAKRLGLKGTSTHLTMNLAGGGRKSENSEALQISVVSPTDEDVQKSMNVYTVRKPCTSAKTVSKKSVERFSHLKPVVDKLHLCGGAIDLFIGTDFSDAFLDIHSLSGQSGEPIAKLNCFGWYIVGQVETESSNISGIRTVDVGTADVHEDFRKLLQQDMLGIKPTELCTCSDNDMRENKFVKSVSESTKLVDGRVQVQMPWKETGPPTRSNHDIALKRLYSVEKSFKKKGCLDIIDAEVQKLLDSEFVSKIPETQVDHTKPEWYLPLQAVFTPEKSTQVRLVFDSSSKGHDGMSLNDRLEKGPNFINDLPSVLAAWRWDEVGYAGDIRKMFNQILIHPNDQVFHRFLWRSDPNVQPSTYQWLRLNFGDKPAPDIATNAINTLAKASQSEFPQAAKELKLHAYVDDICGSKGTTTQAKQVTQEIDAILAKGRFHIKTWHSNSKDVDQSNEGRHTDVLGHSWNKHEDSFSFKKDSVVKPSEEFTKRNCLALVAQLWDPIGLSTPVTIKFRIDLQELWSLGLHWDDILPEDLQHKWTVNTQAMNELLSFNFERKLKPSSAVGVPQVHGFSDGGEQAYGAVIFLRWTLKDGSFQCVPVTAKAFVAPLKKKSIPRLELMGCLALSRLYESCKSALAFINFKSFEKTFWVDSTTALSWIKTPPQQFRPFVSARVAEIQEAVGSTDFHYVESKLNHADALTRGIDSSRLASWLEGPSFLKLPAEEWPSVSEIAKDLPEDRETLKERKSPSAAVKEADVRLDEVERQEPENPILAHLMKNCSSFSKTRRVLAFILRFIQNCSKGGSKTSGPISVAELKRSETRLYQWCQAKLDLAKLDQSLMAKEGKDKLLRAHGRLEDIRTLPDEMRNPVILPKNHQLVTLILQDSHEKRAHCGHTSLIHEARKKYWIIGLRSMAKQITRHCVTCKKLRRRPLEQLMGQIPTLPVGVGLPAFSHTALDMFGPLHIRLNRKTLKEAQVIIFACMTTRAIHLELVSDRGTDTFLMAFRRFACLRGHPRKCWSDCGTNFVGAQEYLAEVMENWDIPKIQTVLAEEFTCDFEWSWNIPKASHQNGVVESLIKSARQALAASFKNQTFTEEQWRTLLAEITYMINGRPLYPSSEDLWESPPVTPNDILIGQHCSPPQPDFEERVNPRDLLRSTEQKANEFWRCWLKYFSPNLLPRNKWYRTRENVQVGDLVLHIDPKQKRSRWEMAIVCDVYPGADGLVRKVRIKTQHGEYDRPVHKLCLIATKQELAG